MQPHGYATHGSTEGKDEVSGRLGDERSVAAACRGDDIQQIDMVDIHDDFRERLGRPLRPLPQKSETGQERV